MGPVRQTCEPLGLVPAEPPVHRWRDTPKRPATSTIGTPSRITANTA